MTTPDYKLVMVNNINVPQEWFNNCDPDEVQFCKDSIEKVGTALVPFVLMRDSNDYGVLKYTLMHEQQTAMLIAYYQVGNPSSCPAIVLDSDPEAIEFDLDGIEYSMEQLDYCFGTQPELEFDENPSEYNKVEVFEVGDYYLVVVHFNYRHEGNTYSRLLSKCPKDDYLDKLRDVDRETYFNVAQWALKK